MRARKYRGKTLIDARKSGTLKIELKDACMKIGTDYACPKVEKTRCPKIQTQDFTSKIKVKMRA